MFMRQLKYSASVNKLRKMNRTIIQLQMSYFKGQSSTSVFYSVVFIFVETVSGFDWLWT